MIEHTVILKVIWVIEHTAILKVIWMIVVQVNDPRG
jgi:hypothetical protein